MARFAAAAASAVLGEPATAAVSSVEKGSTAEPPKKKVLPVVAKADAKLWRREKEWKCHKCQNVCSKLTTSCLACDFDNLSIVKCSLCSNKQPAIAEICLKCKRPLKFSV